MKLGIVTIQKNRAQWLPEWVAFHHLVGFRKFYIYLHNCDDGSSEVVAQLSKLYDIKAFSVPTDTFRPQLVAWQHAYDSFSHEADWLAFIDGDEFLFPVTCMDLRDELEDFRYRKISALAAYWKVFGSAGHIEEPKGLVTENLRLCTENDFQENRHIKSIVRTGQATTAGNNAHLFVTPWGTFDELMRPIDKGWMKEYEPSYTRVRINHYAYQSADYFYKVKKYSGAADAGKDLVRDDEGFLLANSMSRSFDTSLEKYEQSFKSRMLEIEHYLKNLSLP